MMCPAAASHQGLKTKRLSADKVWKTVAAAITACSNKSLKFDELARYLKGNSRSQIVTVKVLAGWKATNRLTLILARLRAQPSLNLKPSQAQPRTHSKTKFEQNRPETTEGF